MDEARMRSEWQRTAALVCMVHNAMVDTRKTGPLMPDKVHPLANDEDDWKPDAAPAAPELKPGRFKDEDARKIAEVFGAKKTVYKVKG